jgi:hypothetical protein
MSVPPYKVHRKTYPEVGKCIYACDVANPKSEEHIIPYSFGGDLKLPNACCQKHRDITSSFENECLNGMFSVARTHLEIHGRRKLRPRELPVWIADKDDKHVDTFKIPKELHPSAVIVPTMPFPEFLLGLVASENAPLPAIGFQAIPVTPNFNARVSNVGGRIKLIKGTGFDTYAFYRLLAKIGHAFTVAEIGLDNFTPTLMNVINDEKMPNYANHFIGSGLTLEPRSEFLHEIGFEPPISRDGETYFVVRIRLFAHLGTVHHYAVTGLKKAP